MTQTQTAGRQPGSRVIWYRTRIDRELLNELNQRSNLWGFLQTGGYLGLLATTGAAAWYVSIHFSWPYLLPILFLHAPATPSWSTVSTSSATAPCFAANG